MGKGCPKFVFGKLNEVSSFDSSATSGNASKDEADDDKDDATILQTRVQWNYCAIVI